MSAPDLPGVRPSPFDPTPWPPWDRVAAAGLGEFYGSLVREIDRELSVDGVTAETWAQGKIAAAKQDGLISATDAVRLTALVSSAADAPNATALFEEAMDDPSAGPLAIGMLSLASYKEQHSTTDAPTDATDYIAGMVAGYSGGLLPYLVLSEVVRHVHIRIT
jgi:hypothetical protein